MNEGRLLLLLFCYFSLTEVDMLQVPGKGLYMSSVC